MDPTALILKDIRYPSEIDWWPLALGWWLIVFIIVLTLTFFGYKYYNQWKRNRARRLALNELKEISNNALETNDLVILSKELSTLLRRTFLAYFPRERVAGLVGESWLHFLDQGLNKKYFSEGIGRKLISMPYQKIDIEESFNVDELIDVIKLRIQTPITKESKS